jgi:selenocysteine lyase/cysteine desulfurase
VGDWEAVRISTALYNTREEIDRLVQILWELDC